MKELKTKRIETDPLFDGHPEKPFQKMTPPEKINYLWFLIEFRSHTKDIKIIRRQEKLKK